MTVLSQVRASTPIKRPAAATKKIQAVLRLIERIRDSSVNVMISGESGAGKDLVAKALHYSSPRSRNTVRGTRWISVSSVAPAVYHGWPVARW